MQPQQAGPWVPVALSKDLPAGVAMPVRVRAAPLALWRSQSGRLAAFADRCPHRGMRLSHGFVRGEALSCIYHGWRYAASGACLHIPAHPELTPPEAIRVAAAPVAEAGGVVWVAGEATPDAPPSLEGFAPLRTMTARAALARLEAVAGAASGPNGVLAVAQEGAAPLFLLLAEQGEGQTLIHALVAPDASPAARSAASRGAEALRRSAEARQQKENGR